MRQRSLPIELDQGRLLGDLIEIAYLGSKALLDGPV
jgi:hypothetical protein